MALVTVDVSAAERTAICASAGVPDTAADAMSVFRHWVAKALYQQSMRNIITSSDTAKANAIAALGPPPIL